MSNQNKLNWLVLILLLSCVWWLVFVDITRSGTIERFNTKDRYRGLECVYNCEYFDEVTR